MNGAASSSGSNSSCFRSMRSGGRHRDCSRDSHAPLRASSAPFRALGNSICYGPRAWRNLADLPLNAKNLALTRFGLICLIGSAQLI